MFLRGTVIAVAIAWPALAGAQPAPPTAPGASPPPPMAAPSPPLAGGPSSRPEMTSSAPSAMAPHMVPRIRLEREGQKIDLRCPDIGTQACADLAARLLQQMTPGDDNDNDNNNNGRYGNGNGNDNERYRN